MKSKLISFFFCVGMFTLNSCSNENEEVIKDSSLRITTDITTRSVIESTSFASGDEIGIFYMERYNNIYARYSDGWSFGKISLSETPAPVYAYYPYVKNWNGQQVSIDISPDAIVTGQADFLYGKSVESVSAASPEAFIRFNHALARITLSIRRSANDAGNGVLSNVSLQNAENSKVISTSGKMDVTTGVISDNVFGAVSLDMNCTLSSESAQNVDILVIPTVMETEGMAELVLAIDGSHYIVKMPAATWEAGQQYTYPITINRTDAHISATPAKIGDYYYGDGTWSSAYNADKACVGIIFALSEEQDGDINIALSESMHGRIAALQDLTATYQWANNTNTDVEGIPHFTRADGERSNGYLPVNGIEGETVSTPQLPYGVYTWPTEKGELYALTDYAGKSHSSFINDEQNYPAGYACFSLVTEGLNNNEPGFWYLPSIGELARLATLCNANLLDPTGNSLFKALEDEYYWSSTEGGKPEVYVWTYNGKSKGILQYQAKELFYKVRAVASF